MNTGTGYIDQHEEFRKALDWIFEDKERAKKCLIEAGILDKDGHLAAFLR